MKKAHGLRGSALEELINITNEQYAEKKLALIQNLFTNLWKPALTLLKPKILPVNLPLSNVGNSVQNFRCMQ